jgi:LysR family transcriptional regulator, glycine cleavage system transcriptional activator
MQRIPSTQALQCLEASARLGSFTRAGHALNLTQGGVSRHIQSLEAWLGLALFDRQRGGLVLTDAGTAYLEEVLPALRQLEAATAQALALRGQGGALNLSIPASWGNHWLLPRLSSFTQNNPSVCLNLLTQVGHANFASQGVDAAVEYREAARHDSPCFAVMPLELAAYAAPSWLARHRLAKTKGKAPQIEPEHMLQHNTLPNAWQGWQAAAGVSQPVQPTGPRFDLMYVAMNAAMSELGVVLLPKFMAQAQVDQAKLEHVGPQSWPTGGAYFLSQSPWLKRETAFKAFADWLTAQVKQSG